MPWNMFITADAVRYFLKTFSLGNTFLFQYFREVKLGGTEYAENFQSYLGIAAQVPNLLFNLVNLFVQVK